MAKTLPIWVFEQLGGDKLRFELGAHAAPHGRPRQGAVVTQKHIYRQATYRYQGRSLPTRHVFGSSNAPAKINGRWRDRRGGEGFARAKHREAQAFFEAQQNVRITWGDVYSVVGFVSEYEWAPESAHEILYEITFEVDEDLFLGSAAVIPERKRPENLSAAILANSALLDAVTKTPDTMTTSVFDLLDSLVGAINTASAFVLEVTDRIDSYATAQVQALARLRSGLEQYSVAVDNLRSTYDRLTGNEALESEDTDNAQAFWEARAIWSADALRVMFEVAAAEREASIAQAANVKEIRTAGDGDTWESFAFAAYGSAERADEIREANDVPAGSNPVPGTDYFIPR